MKLKNLEISKIIDILNTFCERSGIHAADMETIANGIQELNGNVYAVTLKETFDLYLKGLIDIKPPYKINNLFISQIIYKTFDIKRAETKKFIQEEEPKPTPEEIEIIFSTGLQESKFRIKSFLAGRGTYFDPFFLFNEFQYLVNSGRLNPDDFTDEEIRRMTEKFKKYDKMNSKDHVNFTPEMTEVEYQKAAVVGLYLIN